MKWKRDEVIICDLMEAVCIVDRIILS